MEEPLVLMNLFFSFVSFLEDALALSRWRIIPFPFIDIMFHFSDQTTGNRHLYGWSIQVPNARNRCLHSESSRHKKQWPLLIEPGFHASTSFSFCDNHCSFFPIFQLACKTDFSSPITMWCKNEMFAFLWKRLPQMVEHCSSQAKAH